jgi:hypothetical protein
MTTLANTRTTTGTTTRTGWVQGLATGVVAAIVVAAVAALFSAAGHPLSVGDGPDAAIPLLGFAQMVLIGALVGIPLARHTSRRTFVRTAVALTALSCVPSLALGTTAIDKAGLVLTHVVAAAIIVPRLARS